MTRLAFATPGNADASYTGALTTLGLIPIGSVDLTGTIAYDVLGRASDSETGSWTTEVTALSLSGGGLIVWEMAACAHGAADGRIQALYGVRRIDDAPDFVREGEEGDDLAPMAPPSLSDRGIFLSPWPGCRIRLHSFPRIARI